MTAVFTIPEPGRWALVAIDYFVVFDVLGWRYDPETNESQPVASSRRNRGAGVIHDPDGFYALVPQWDGIRFGMQRQPAHLVPEDVRARVALQIETWNAKRVASYAAAIP